MTINQVNSLKKLMITQQNHWVFFPLIYFFMLVVPVNPIKPGVPVLVWFTLGCFPYLFYTVKNATDNTVIFLGVHAATLIFAILLPTPHQVCKIAYVGCTFLYCVYSVFFRYSQEGTDEKAMPLPVPFGITFVILLLLQYFRMYEYQRFVVNILVINIFMYCLAKYVENYSSFLGVNKHSVGYMPVKRIFFSGMGGMTAFASVLAVILFVVANLGRMDDVVRSVLQFIGSIIRKIKLKFRNGGTEDYTLEEITGEHEIGQFTAREEAATWPIWDVLVTVIFMLIVVYVMYKVITLLPYILRFFRMPSQVVNEEDGVEDIHESTMETEQLQRRPLKRIWEYLTPAQKIRRRYKKRVSDSKDIIASKGKKDCMEWYTARECGNILEQPKMSDLYEKARYSPYECTAEDVKNMKAACKK